MCDIYMKFELSVYEDSEKWDIDCGAPIYIPLHWLSISLLFENSFYDHFFVLKYKNMYQLVFMNFDITFKFCRVFFSDFVLMVVES